MSLSPVDMNISSGKTLISLRGAIKRYGSNEVLRIPQFDVFAGDRIEIIGSNSSGKSTLVRILSGYGLLSKGTCARSPSMRYASVGFLPQYGGLFPELSLMQNVVAISRLLGRKGEINPHSERVFSDLELYDFLDQRASSLSGGIQRLGALAAIVAARPRGLILDEPFAGLDAQKFERVRAFLCSENYAFDFILFTGHEPTGVFDAGKTVRIEQGKILTAPMEVEAAP